MSEWEMIMQADAKWSFLNMNKVSLRKFALETHEILKEKIYIKWRGSLQFINYIGEWPVIVTNIDELSSSLVDVDMLVGNGGNIYLIVA